MLSILKLEFYTRCITLMVDCQDFTTFESIVSLTCRVSICKYEGYLHIVDSAVSSRKNLEKHIENWRITNEQEINKDLTRTLAEEDVSDEHENQEYCTDAIESWIRSIQDKSSFNSDGNVGEIKGFYLPAFFKQFGHLPKDFPLWSGVMVPFFQSVYEHASSLRNTFW